MLLWWGITIVYDAFVLQLETTLWLSQSCDILLVPLDDDKIFSKWRLLVRKFFYLRTKAQLFKALLA